MPACLVFSLGELRCAVPAASVREIVWLCAVTPVAGASAAVDGVIHLRGRIVPVLDPDVRLGRPARPRRLTDKIVVVEAGERVAGLVVSEVHAVRELPVAELEAAPAAVRAAGVVSPHVAGVVTLGEEILLLLGLDTLLELPLELEAGPAALLAPELGAGAAADAPWGHPEQAILRARARSLMAAQQAADTDRLLPLAVIGLGGEYFGVELEDVREFSGYAALTPVPCCPAHVAGVINLRGEMVTVVDLRRALHLAAVEAPEGAQVMVVQAGDLRVGVVVDEVLDVVYLRPEDVAAVPCGVQGRGEPAAEGAARYGDRMLSVLDLRRLLLRDELAVHEHV